MTFSSQLLHLRRDGFILKTSHMHKVLKVKGQSKIKQTGRTGGTVTAKNYGE